MADYNITSAQLGLYELALTAGIDTSIQIDRDPGISSILATSVQVAVHDAASPVYYSLNPVQPKDPAAVIIMPGTWIDVDLIAGKNTIHLVCASAATVSVSRT